MGKATVTADNDASVRRLAFADPPYLGMSHIGAEHHYGAHHPDAGDFDTVDAHRDLVGHLVDDFPDGWALCLSSRSLRVILPMCPEDVRVAAWVKGWCSWKPGISPAYAWEPVIFRGGRRMPDAVKARDWLQANVRTGQAIPGSKPESFCRWVLLMLGYRAGDTLVDLFPGTGIMGQVVDHLELWPTLDLELEQLAFDGR
jgi:hypothetical protein